MCTYVHVYVCWWESLCIGGGICVSVCEFVCMGMSTVVKICRYVCYECGCE